MIIPPNRVERPAAAAHYHRIIAPTRHGPHSLLAFEARGEVLAVVPLSALRSEIDNAHAAAVPRRGSIRGLHGVVEVVEVRVDLGPGLPRFCLERLERRDEVRVVCVRRPEAPSESGGVGGRGESEAARGGEPIQADG